MNNAEWYRLFDSVWIVNVHDFWAQIAIVALLQGHDEIAMSSRPHGTTYGTSSIANRIAQRYINPRTR